jgi:hypothetical protein
VKRTKRAILVSSVALLLLSTLYFNPAFCLSASAQKDKKIMPTVPLLTRTTTRHDSLRFAYGGTVTIVGAPAGSLTIEGWQRSEVDVTAEIELQAPSAPDLDRLSVLNSVAIDEDANHIRIITTGTHDKKFLKRVAKDLPKSLIGLPWKVDYHIKVPAMTALDIDSGNGPIKLSGVEGAIRLNALQSEADLSLTGSDVLVIIQTGTVNVSVPARAWHGLRAEIKLASGKLNLELMPGFNGDIDAEVLRTGEVKNNFPGFVERERNSITPRSIRARAGSGGATLAFTVGDGAIEISSSGKQ